MGRTHIKYTKRTDEQRSSIKIRNYFPDIFISMLIFICTIGIAPTVLANPVDGQVAAGAVTITNPSANAVHINQTSQKAIINWQSFNIGQQETTHFQQPVGGMVLNRISPTQGASAIYGQLTATGQVILINPAGIFFGSSAYVNVGALIATTANITDQNFMNGNYYFSSVAPYNGFIINQGTIIATDHGLVALIGNNVQNDGLIQANLGHLVLASGNTFILTFAGNQLISFSVDEKSSSGGGITNTGTLRADGGQILITANAASGILDNVINMEGVLQARSVHLQNGKIIVLSVNPEAGVVRIAAKLDVSGKNSGEKGGVVEISGYNILLNSPTLIDASGDMGGGNIFVGGNYQGKGPLLNANATVMAAGATFNADAITAGNGGNVIVWADNVTKFFGNISARGGALSGNGGFVETSGKIYLDALGSVDASAAFGTAGLWLLDPANVTLTSVTANGSFDNGNPNTFTTTADTATVNVATINTSLNGGTSVTILTTAGGSQNGDITVSSAISKTAGGAATLTLTANTATGGVINLNNTITSTVGALGITLNAASINLAANLTSFGGAINFNAPVVISGTRILNSAAGAINFNNTLNGTSGLTITSTGTTTFSGIVGGTLPLTSITTSASGTTVINGGAITTTGIQTYNDAVVLGADTTLTTTNSAVTFASTLNSDAIAARALTVSVGTTGGITLTGNVGASNALGAIALNTTGTTTLTGTIAAASLTTNTGGGTTINSSAINTSNNILFNDAVTLGVITKALTSTAGSITFGSTLNGAFGLTLSGNTGVIFNGTVGTTVASLTVTGPTVINADITTTGAQLYNSAITFTGDRILNSSGTSGNITIIQPLSWSGSNALSLTAIGTSGTLVLPSSIIATNGSLTLNAGNITNSINASAVTINVGDFNLTRGQWVQISNSLPAFSATNFRINSGGGASSTTRFVRALSGGGTSTIDPYLITDIYGLQGIGSGTFTLASHFKLANSIDLSATTGWNSGAGFNPIGSSTGTSGYSGSFDGDQFTLSNLFINRPSQDNVGLFGRTTNTVSNLATVSNLNLTNVNVTGRDFVGGLMGFAAQNQTHIDNVSVSGNVVGRNIVGLLVGRTVSNNLSPSITNSHTSGTVFGVSSVGGLVGSLLNNNNMNGISGSYSTATVSGTTDVGGLVGIMQGNDATVTISNSYASGNVTGVTNVGGLVGRMQGQDINTNNNLITNSYSTSQVTGSTNVGGLVGNMVMLATGSGANTVSDSYSAGTIITTGAGNAIGGLVGLNDSFGVINNTYSISSIVNTGATNVGGLIGQNTGIVNSSYWNIETSGVSTSAGGTGKTSAAMMAQSTYSGWDFTSTWNINESTSFPYLRVFPPIIPPVTPPAVSGLTDTNTSGGTTLTLTNTGTIANILSPYSHSPTDAINNVLPDILITNNMDSPISNKILGDSYLMPAKLLINEMGSGHLFMLINNTQPSTNIFYIHLLLTLLMAIIILEILAIRRLFFIVSVIPIPANQLPMLIYDLPPARPITTATSPHF